MTRFLGLAILLPAALLPAHGRPGGATDEVDSGSFSLYLNGAPIGEERFLIRADRAGGAGSIFRAGAGLTLKLDGRTMRVSVALESLGACCQPRRYEAEFNGGEATTVVGTAIGDRIRLEVRSPRGEEMKELLLRGKTAIVERHVAHHYFFVAKLLGDERSAQATLIVPSDRAEHRVRLQDHGIQSVSIRGGQRQLRHVTAVGPNLTHHIWLDGDRVIKVEVTDLGFVAVRSDPGGTGP